MGGTPKRTFPRSRAAADNLRPKKIVQRKGRTNVADLFTENNPTPQPPSAVSPLSVPQSPSLTKEGIRKNYSVWDGREAGITGSERSSPMDEFDGLGRRKKKHNHAKPVSTFEELKMAVAAVQERLEGLCVCCSFKVSFSETKKLQYIFPLTLSAGAAFMCTRRVGSTLIISMSPSSLQR